MYCILDTRTPAGNQQLEQGPQIDPGNLVGGFCLINRSTVSHLESLGVSPHGVVRIHQSRRSPGMAKASCYMKTGAWINGDVFSRSTQNGSVPLGSQAKHPNPVTQNQPERAICDVSLIWGSNKPHMLIS